MNFKNAFSIVSVVTVLSVRIFAEIGNELWTFQTGNAIFASPTIDGDGNVYIGSLDGKLYSIDKDGAERWSTQTGDWIESSAALSHDESVVYVGSWDNKLYALDTADGQTRWTYEIGNLIFASPAVGNDGTLYFGGADGFLYALNPDGTLNWEVFVGGELDSSVAIGRAGELYVATSAGVVYSFDSSGQELWAFTVPDEFGAAGRETLIASSCMLSGTGELYVGSDNFFLYALDANDGTMLWSYETGGEIDASPTMSIEGNVLVSSRDGYIYSLDTDGGLVWKTDIGLNYYTSAVLDEIGRIYVSSYISATLSYLNLLSPDGTILQQVAFPDIIDSSVTISPDGVLYVGAYDGKLYAFKNGARISNSVWPKFRQGLASRGELEGYVAPRPGYERLFNISLRSSPLGGENDIIAGFIVEGSGEKKLLIRGVGPGLESHNISEFLENPKVEYHHSIDGNFDGNDDWGDSASASALADEMNRVGGFALEEGSADSADILSLGEGLYTAIMSNAGGQSGVALLEIYDADVGDPEARLVNLSMRGRSGQGEEVMIAGFVIDGNLPKRVLIRAIGKGLSKLVKDVLLDPTLRLYSGQEVLDSNDDWDAHLEREQLEAYMRSAGAFELKEGSGDSAIFVWLEPGLYTVIVSGKSGQSGVALMEIYDLTGK